MYARELPHREPWIPVQALPARPARRPIRPPLASEYVKVCCPAHGWYLSASWTMPVRPGLEASSLQMGCPECIRQHARRRYGGSEPDLPEIHRPNLASQGGARA